MGAMRSAVVRVLGLAPRDRRCALEAAAQLTRASLELRLVPAARTVRLLGSLRTSDLRDESASAARLQEAQWVGRIVARVARRLPWRPSCLRQGLAVQRMLRRRGIPSELHLGVAANAAHAWVTVDGHPVLGGPGAERFVALAAFR